LSAVQFNHRVQLTDAYKLNYAENARKTQIYFVGPLSNTIRIFQFRLPFPHLVISTVISHYNDGHAFANEVTMYLQGTADVRRKLNYSGLHWNRLRRIRFQIFW